MRRNKTIWFAAIFIVATIAISYFVSRSEAPDNSFEDWVEVYTDSVKPDSCKSCGSKAFASCGYGLYNPEYDDSIAAQALEGDTSVIPFSSLGCAEKIDTFPVPIWQCIKCGATYGTKRWIPPKKSFLDKLKFWED